MDMIDKELSQLLVDCLKLDESPVDPSRLSDLSAECWQSLLTLARAQRVSPLFRHRLRQKGLDHAVPVDVADELRRLSSRNTARNLRFYGELRRLLSALKAEGIPLILLKGIYIADAVYDNIGLREMSDIDVLARSADLSRIAEILIGLDYTPQRAFLADTTILAHQHLPRMTKKGHAAFEVHWNLTGPGLSYSIEPGDLWEHAFPVQIAGFDALALSPEDLLLHLCLHTSYQHQFTFGLRPSCDIAETIARFRSTLDWETLTERALKRGWQRGAYLALLLSKELAGADVPDGTLERLRPQDITGAVISNAHALVFSDKELAVSVPTPFAELLNSSRFRDKVRIFLRQVFLPRAIIASLYSIPVDSFKIYIYYPRRLLDVVRRHGRTLKKHHNKDDSLTTLVDRKCLIADWLSKLND